NGRDLSVPGERPRREGAPHALPQLHPVVQTELPEEVVQVALDSGLTQLQLVRNLSIPQPERDRTATLQLHGRGESRGKTGGREAGAASETRQQLMRGRGV